jgi:hypothetical protein
MRRILLFLVLIFNTYLGWTVDFNRTNVWREPISAENLKLGTASSLFAGAVLVEGSTLPYWVESFELQQSNAEVAITNLVFEPLIGHSMRLPDSIGPDIQLSTVTHTSAGKSFLRVSVFPFVKKNGQIQRLTEFTLSIVENSNTTKSVTATYPWKSTSVLGSGKWTKIKAKNKGIYKITYDQLKLWGYSNPENVCMYGNDGYMLPVLNRDLKSDDLAAYRYGRGKTMQTEIVSFFILPEVFK